jgi:biopolymer transport protein ExbD
MALETGNASGEMRGDINLTPLIDVLLVLLIIFMVISPIVPHGLESALPRRAVNLNTRPETAIVVQIIRARNGSVGYKINQDDVSINELGSRLSFILSIRADKVMFVRGDDGLDFSTIAKVMDIGRGAGADHIGLLTSKDML